jgi:hypothetical protein
LELCLIITGEMMMFGLRIYKASQNKKDANRLVAMLIKMLVRYSGVFVCVVPFGELIPALPCGCRVETLDDSAGSAPKE